MSLTPDIFGYLAADYAKATGEEGHTELPAGTYLAIIKSVDLAASKDQRTHMLQVRMQVDSTIHKGSKFLENIIIGRYDDVKGWTANPVGLNSVKQLAGMADEGFKELDIVSALGTLPVVLIGECVEFEIKEGGMNAKTNERYKNTYFKRLIKADSPLAPSSPVAPTGPAPLAPQQVAAPPALQMPPAPAAPPAPVSGKPWG